MSRRGGLLLPLILLAVGSVLVLLAWQGLRVSAPTQLAAATAVAASTGVPIAAAPLSPTAEPELPSETPTEESRAYLVTSTFTTEPPATATATPTETPFASAEPPDLTEATPPPVPTFTPPPMNGVAAGFDEHYWLQRPISADYANWSDRIYPYGSTRGGSFRTHHGVEFFNPVGVPVLAAAPGVVVTAGTDDEVQFGPQASFYGNLVVIRHDQLYGDQFLYTLYGHLSQVLVSEGQLVAAGDVVGLVGGTGVANGGAHLHFEVRIGANSYDATRNPELWLQPFSGWGTIAGKVVWPDGSYVYEAPLLIQRADDPTLFIRRSVYTYADGMVNPDDVLGENFTSPDVEPGPYEIVFHGSTVTRRQLVWVYPGRTSFVTIQVPVEATSEP
jgi:murein DD-endopeptidase MepM/ murein hydrolase activator NlpD